MQTDYLDTQILLHDDDHLKSSRSSILGQIIFTPKRNLRIEELGYQVVIIAKNKYYNYTQIIPTEKKIIFRNKVMKKGKNYSYEIEFTPAFSTSFTSKDISLKSSIQTIVKLQTSSYLKVRKDYLDKNNLSTFTDTNQLLWSKKRFSLDPSIRNYVVEEKEYFARNEYQRPWIYFLAGTIISIIVTTNLNISNKNQIFLIVVAFLFSIFIIPQLYKEYILRNIVIKTKQVGKNQFGIFLDLSKTWKRIRSVKTIYGIFGTIYFDEAKHREPYNFDIYMSPPIEKSKINSHKEDILDFPEVNYDFIFDFPKENLPTTFKNNSILFYWEFKITVYFFLGIKSEFIKEIKVRQEPHSLKQ